MAEFVVAASDSISASRRFGDRFSVGDATPIIQSAIDALPAAGGTVRILPGNYLLKKQVGQSHCLLLTGSNKRLIFDQGATLKLADNQFESTAGQVIEIADDSLTGLSTPNQIAVNENLALWGPGVIDGNEANDNAKAIGVKCRGNTLWFRLGGGLLIKNCESNPLSLSGASVGGDPANYRMKRTIIDGLRVVDSTEGVFLIGMDDTTITHLHIENISAQDGLEPITCNRLTMSASCIRDCFGSALDLFASGAGATQSGHVYSNCVFGPRKDSGDPAGNIIAISVGGTEDDSDHIIANCIILMGEVNAGIRMGDTGTGSTKGIQIIGNLIAGTGGGTSADGILVGANATETTIFGNHISNCLGNAINRSADPAKLHIKSNSGWGNGAGISAGIGADNVLTANDFI